MLLKMGFTADVSTNESKENMEVTPMQTVPRRSVVQVYFKGRNMTLSYYNDRFDLHCGDFVYVEGKLEGLMGRVTEVNYNFKIKLSDYKRVIAVVDTNVHGQFFAAESHFVTFNPNTLPRDKVLMWFKAPMNDEEEYVSGSDDSAFFLDNLGDMNVSASVVERGNEYYMDNKVRYISLDGTRGYAIVEGNEGYEVEFEYRNGEISHLTCSCFCSYNCKHEFAAMLQLRETLGLIEDNYAAEYKETGYFAAINKTTLFTFAVGGKTKGSFVL